MSVFLKLDANTVLEVTPSTHENDGPRLALYSLDREFVPSAAVTEALAALLVPSGLEGGK